MTHLYACLVTLSLALFACGGGDDPPAVDAPPAELTGLGQKCDINNNTCPANAPACINVNLGTSASTSYCSPRCVMNGTGTGAAGGMSNIMPAPNSATCSAEYMGTVGTPECGVILAYTPMGPITVGTSYTGVEIACAIRCGANNTCAEGFTPNTQVGACLCFPNPA